MKELIPESNPVQRAVKACITQSALAEKVGVRPQAVQQWVASGRVPAKRVIAVERATGGRVTRHELDPELYPLEAV